LFVAGDWAAAYDCLLTFPLGLNSHASLYSPASSASHSATTERSLLIAPRKVARRRCTLLLGATASTTTLTFGCAVAQHVEGYLCDQGDGVAHIHFFQLHCGLKYWLRPCGARRPAPARTASVIAGHLMRLCIRWHCIHWLRGTAPH
jgi:hypothetical protein